MARPGRRTGLLAALLAVVLAVAAGVVALLVGRAAGPDDVAADYLAATWEGDWRTECDLATEEWRRYLYEGHPFARCADYAEAADEARSHGGFADFAEDTDVEVSAETVGDDDGRARVAYVIEFSYHGDDRDGFDALWQGGGAVDRGTVELVDVDGDWRVAGVDAG